MEGSHPHDWPDEYPQLEELHGAAAEVLRLTLPTVWDSRTVEELLESLSIDNEAEFIADQLSQEQLVALAKASFDLGNDEARWQLASRLSQLPETDERESLLTRFLNDEDEYVRRRALLAAGECRSPQVERAALKAWRSDEEYQRLVALHVLWQLKSPRLEHHLEIAETDSSEFVRKRVREIRLGQGEYESVDG